MHGPTLILDIGSGTQDVLYHFPGLELENCPKFVLPSTARMVARRINALQGRPLWLHGRNMGGGFFRALQAHLDAGGPVAATQAAAYSIGDDLEQVRAKGIEFAEDCPHGYEPVLLADYVPEFWHTLLDHAGLERPAQIMACAQDHGFHPGRSNRLGRFTLWKRLLLESHGNPADLLYSNVPTEMTRLADLQASIGGGLVADTGAAAVLGALHEAPIAAHSHAQGITVVNVGNSHLIAFLIYQERIWGVYEHHTGLVDAARLQAHLERFRTGSLPMDEVFEDRGHGCLTLDLPEAARGFTPTYVLGPRRHLLQGAEVTFPAPGGDMMLAGCFGMLKGRELRHG
ncbi:MAG: DUF1786 domain-containing protein [Desulfovibrio sp.]|nr:DUF1786 domain-containing protein [Desulfovibrio sp.]